MPETRPLIAMDGEGRFAWRAKETNSQNQQVSGSTVQAEFIVRLPETIMVGLNATYSIIVLGPDNEEFVINGYEMHELSTGIYSITDATHTAPPRDASYIKYISVVGWNDNENYSDYTEIYSNLQLNSQFELTSDYAYYGISVVFN